ncbi:cytidine deaminase [Sneathiella sp. P13V-1]|uniref:cytidine deaminase n=1 Tax=Sneathiella sp. P13V-1 TaxID=2697366 RepID=UPI00187B25CF|nr:cytidine deaminase [Sneathiella sp. P13V-1]MBE7638470.1 cytidine deaminase [Sneathiella sp. P13V-1]
MSAEMTDLEKLAEHVAKNAYSPYSTFSVGAAIRTTSGNVYSGCNVENVSSGLTVCAERNAVGAAIAAEGKSMRIEEVFVTNFNAEGATIHCSPCGACRQVMAEFSTPDTKVIYRGDEDNIVTTMGQLLPDGFTL